LEVGAETVERVRHQLAREGSAAALVRRRSRRVYRLKLDESAEAHLIAQMCGESPAIPIGGLALHHRRRPDQAEATMSLDSVMTEH